jgi:hypothetical protein
MKRATAGSRAGVTTAVVVVAAIVLAACGGSSKHGASATTVAKTTTTTAKRAVVTAAPAPLTGVPDPSGAAARRCAITVKIDNSSFARPRSGIDQADVVYEEVVEGLLTRLAAVFNSKAPDVVGPVRSVRKTDQSLVTPLRGIFAYSGGAAYAIASINTAPVVQLDETRAGPLMFRDHSRKPPHNLYAHVDQMYARCKDGAPIPLFAYRAAGTAPSGTPATSFTVGFKGLHTQVTWQWDTAAAGWRRILDGTPEVTTTGAALEPKNVVVMFAHYVGGNSENLGAEAQLTGQGTAWVFTAARVIKGTWVRPDRSRAAQLLDESGKVVRLTPGPTWVELPETTYAVTVTP